MHNTTSISPPQEPSEEAWFALFFPIPWFFTFFFFPPVFNFVSDQTEGLLCDFVLLFFLAFP